MARKYHNLAGLVRDIEHAVEAGGTAEWDLLSRLDNALLAIEEADPHLEGESIDESGDDDSDDGSDEGGDPQLVDRRVRPDELIQRMGAQVPRGTPSRPQGGVGVVRGPDPVDGMQQPVTFTARGDKRRGT